MSKETDSRKLKSYQKESPVFRNLFSDKKNCASMETIKLLMTFHSPAEIKVKFSLHNTSVTERVNLFSQESCFGKCALFQYRNF